MGCIHPQLLAKLVDEHQPALVLYAKQWCEMPEDVVQEAFLQLVRQIPPPQKHLPWLYKVVRNRAITAGRASRRRERHETGAANARPAWFTPAVDTGFEPADVERALRKLPDAQREIVIARLWGGLSFEEVAELTASSTSTAHRLYHTALLMLRASLLEKDDGPRRPKPQRSPLE